MTDTPLKIYLTAHGKSAEEFATANQLSPWSVRHWTRGDKEPALTTQLKIERATSGSVRPADWLEWRLSILSDKAA